MTDLFSLQAEQSVLGGLLRVNDALDEVEPILDAADFHRRDHREIYAALIALNDARQPFDAVTVSEFLAKSDSRVDLAYLGTLAKNVPSVSNIETYAKIVHDYGLKRELIKQAAEISESAYSGRDSEELLADAQNRIGELADTGVPSGLADPKDVMREVIEALDARFESGGEIHGMTTGFTDFDKRTGGLHGGNLIIVAGRPSMGKSTFVENICEHVAVDMGGVVLVQSLEMPKDMWMERSTSALSGVSSDHLRTGNIEDHEWSLITAAAGKLASSRMFIDDTAAVNLQRARSNARKLKRKHGQVDLIVVDYLQLMRGVGDSREREISSLSAGLKGIAKEMRCPVIALSQLNRGLEARQNKRPMMSDLRESGAIEQDADIICFLYRDEVYNPDSADAGTAEVIIAKQRNGPTGMVRMVFQSDRFRFMDFAGGYG